MNKLSEKELLLVLEKQAQEKFIDIRYIYLRDTTGLSIRKNENSNKIGIIVIGLIHQNCARMSASLCSEYDGFNSITGKVVALKRLLKKNSDGKFPWCVITPESNYYVCLNDYINALNIKQNNYSANYISYKYYANTINFVFSTLIKKLIK